MPMTRNNEFLRQTALFNAIGAAFQRSIIYSDSASTADKDQLKRALERCLRKVERQYASQVSSNKHLQTISGVARSISGHYAAILSNGRFRVGTAQKAVNIYLKLLWCYGWIPEPPHCPVDSIVLAAIGDAKTKWTKIADIAEYSKVIDAIRQHIAETSPETSLSDWELNVWNNRRQKER